MLGFGFRPEHVDSWAALGVAPARGGKDQLTLMSHQMSLAKLRLSVVCRSTWSVNDTAAADAEEQRLQTHATSIALELAAVGGRKAEQKA